MRIRNIDSTGGPREFEDGTVVENGADVELPDEVAERLLEQSTVWERSNARPSEPAEQPAQTEEA